MLSSRDFLKYLTPLTDEKTELFLDIYVGLTNLLTNPSKININSLSSKIEEELRFSLHFFNNIEPTFFEHTNYAPSFDMEQLLSAMNFLRTHTNQRKKTELYANMDFSANLISKMPNISDYTLLNLDKLFSLTKNYSLPESKNKYSYINNDYTKIIFGDGSTDEKKNLKGKSKVLGAYVFLAQALKDKADFSIVEKWMHQTLSSDVSDYYKLKKAIYGLNSLIFLEEQMNPKYNDYNNSLINNFADYSLEVYNEKRSEDDPLLASFSSQSFALVLYNFLYKEVNLDNLNSTLADGVFSYVIESMLNSESIVNKNINGIMADSVDKSAEITELNISKYISDTMSKSLTNLESIFFITPNLEKAAATFDKNIHDNNYIDSNSEIFSAFEDISNISQRDFKNQFLHFYLNLVFKQETQLKKYEKMKEINISNLPNILNEILSDDFSSTYAGLLLKSYDTLEKVSDTFYYAGLNFLNELSKSDFKTEEKITLLSKTLFNKDDEWLSDKRRIYKTELARRLISTDNSFEDILELTSLYVGDYWPIKILGNGAEGTTYLFEHNTPSAKKIAVKLTGETLEHQVLNHLYEKSLDTVVKINDAGYDFGTKDNEEVYMISMDYLEGPDLYTYIEEKANTGGISQEDSITLSADLFLICKTNEENNISNNDFSGKNVKLHSTGKFKSYDFGRATFIDKQGRIDDVDSRHNGPSDYFSLGLIIYEIGTLGNHLFYEGKKEDDDEVKRHEISKVRDKLRANGWVLPDQYKEKIRNNTSPVLADIILTCLENPLDYKKIRNSFIRANSDLEYYFMNSDERYVHIKKQNAIIREQNETIKSLNTKIQDLESMLGNYNLNNGKASGELTA